MDECKDEQTIVREIAGKVQCIKTEGIEPGVEISTGLSRLIDRIFKESIDEDCGLSETARDLLVGAFRSNRHVLLEAHKTIHVLIGQSLQAVFRHKGRMEDAVQGLLEGIAFVSKEHSLNEHEALLIAREDILCVLEKVDPRLREVIKAKMERDDQGGPHVQ